MYIPFNEIVTEEKSLEAGQLIYLKLETKQAAGSRKSDSLSTWSFHGTPTICVILFRLKLSSAKAVRPARLVESEISFPARLRTLR